MLPCLDAVLEDRNVVALAAARGHGHEHDVLLRLEALLRSTIALLYDERHDLARLYVVGAGVVSHMFDVSMRVAELARVDDDRDRVASFTTLGHAEVRDDRPVALDT